MKKAFLLAFFIWPAKMKKQQREAAGMLFKNIDIRNKTIKKAEKRYKIEKEEKSFQRNGWSRKKTLAHNLKKGFRKVAYSLR